MGEAKRWVELGQRAAAEGDHLLAVQHWEQALALEPQNVGLHLEVGTVHARRGEPLRALQCFGEALRLDPKCGMAWNNCGNILLQLGEVSSAVNFYRSAERLEPEDAGIQYNLGRALDQVGEHAEALGYLARACALNPGHADAWVNLGNAHHNLGHLEEALACFDRALPLAANAAEVQVNRAMILLNQGRFAEGWSAYESRWETAAFRAYREMPFGRPQWRGEGLEGKRILLHAEQGFGDAIQFVRFLPAVKARGGTVFLEVQGPVKALLEPLLEPGQVLARGEARPEFDVHCSLMSLPFVLKLGFDGIPQAPYLQAPWAEREEVRRGLDGAIGERRGLRVGIAWRGNPTHRWNLVRSLKPAQLAALAEVEGVEWICLQQDATAEELAGFPLRLTPLEPRYLQGFLSTAAVVEELDLVVSIDTVTAHLTGALGKPLWLLLPAFYDWRWHAHREDSPWYGSARLFRQARPGVWAGAIEALVGALRELVARHGAV